MSNISNVCSNAGKAVEKLSRLEVVGMQEGNARKRKQECEAECKQKRADTRFSSRTDRECTAFIRTVKATNGYELFLMERKERIVGIIDTGAGKPCRLYYYRP
jgi:hypothetical protein